MGCVDGCPYWAWNGDVFCEDGEWALKYGLCGGYPLQGPFFAF